MALPTGPFEGFRRYILRPADKPSGRALKGNGVDIVRIITCAVSSPGSCVIEMRRTPLWRASGYTFPIRRCLHDNDIERLIVVGAFDHYRASPISTALNGHTIVTRAGGSRLIISKLSSWCANRCESSCLHHLLRRQQRRIG